MLKQGPYVACSDMSATGYREPRKVEEAEYLAVRVAMPGRKHVCDLLSKG